MITKREFDVKSFELDNMEESWKMEKELILRKQKLQEEKESLKKSKKKMSTTKIIILFIFMNCTLVELYSMFVMYKFADLGALYALITAVVGETISFAIYAAKSTKENTAGGIVFEKMVAESLNEGIG